MTRVSDVQFEAVIIPHRSLSAVGLRILLGVILVVSVGFFLLGCGGDGFDDLAFTRTRFCGLGLNCGG